MGLPLKLINLPWAYTRNDLTQYLAQTLNTRVKFTRIIYDKQTGLSRGIALVQLANDRTARDVIKRGTLEVDGRTVMVTKGEESRASQDQSQMRQE